VLQPAEQQPALRKAPQLPSRGQKWDPSTSHLGPALQREVSDSGSRRHGQPKAHPTTAGATQERWARAGSPKEDLADRHQPSSPVAAWVTPFPRFCALPRCYDTQQ